MKKMEGEKEKERDLMTTTTIVTHSSSGDSRRRSRRRSYITLVYLLNRYRIQN